MRRSSFRQALVVLAVIILVAAIMSVVQWGLFLSALSHRINPQSPEGIEELRQQAETARPIIDSLEKYRRAYGKYPSELPSDQAGSQWAYSDDRNGYRLYLKLGWDPMLFFERTGENNVHWWYDPGDGSSKTDLAFSIGKSR